MTTEEKRKMLLKAAKGGRTLYEIDYNIDAKGIITILGGSTLDGEQYTKHFLMNIGDHDDYVHLYRGQNGEDYGSDLLKRKREAEARTTEDEIVAAYLEYRRQHPEHVGSMLGSLGAYINDGKHIPMMREDSAEVILEMKRRNRAYIKEFYGEDLPLDFDFKARYDKFIGIK